MRLHGLAERTCIDWYSTDSRKQAAHHEKGSVPKVTDQYSQEPQGDSQDGNDLLARVNGLMSVVGKRTNERDQALARAEAAEAELQAAHEALESRPEPRMDPNRAPKAPYRQPEPMEALKGASWDEFGMDAARK